MVSSPNLTLSPLQFSFSGPLNRNCSRKASSPTAPYGHSQGTTPCLTSWAMDHPCYLEAPSPRPPCSPHSWPCLLGLAPGLLLPAHPGSPPWPPLLNAPSPSGLSICFSPGPLPHPADIKMWDLQAPPCPPLCPAATFVLQERSQWPQIHHNHSELGGRDGKGMWLGSRAGGDDSRLHPHLPRQVSASNA